MKSADLIAAYDEHYFLRKVEGWREFKERKMTRRRIDMLSEIDFKGKKLLDIGFGRGEVIQYCHEHGAQCVGIDYSATAYKLARAYCDKAVRLYQLDIARVDKIPERGFDTVLMLDVLEHVADIEAVMLLMKLQDMVKTGCLVYVLTPVDIRLGDYKGMHFNQWNMEKIKKVFHGYEIIEQKTTHDYYAVLKKRPS